jgi:hypothetical protein
MSPPSFAIRSPVIALAVGLALFAVLSVLRAALQPHLGNASYLGPLLTVVMFVLPGALVGALSPGHSLLYGVLLGVLAGAFVTLQVGHFSHITWATRPTLLTFGIYAGIGIILCEIGSLAGRALALRRRSHTTRVDGPA